MKNKESPIVFINILDGDESFRNKNKFKYLETIKKYEGVKDKIFIGDLFEFQQEYGAALSAST